MPSPQPTSVTSAVAVVEPKKKSRLEQADAKLYQDIQERIKSYKDSDATEKLKKEALIALINSIEDPTHVNWSFNRCIDEVRDRYRRIHNPCKFNDRIGEWNSYGTSHERVVYEDGQYRYYQYSLGSNIYSMKKRWKGMDPWDTIIATRNIFSNQTVNAFIERISYLDRLKRTDTKLYQEIKNCIEGGNRYKFEVLKPLIEKDKFISYEMSEAKQIANCERQTNILETIIHFIDDPQHKNLSFRQCVEAARDKLCYLGRWYKGWSFSYTICLRESSYQDYDTKDKISSFINDWRNIYRLFIKRIFALDNLLVIPQKVQMIPVDSKATTQRPKKWRLEQADQKLYQDILKQVASYDDSEYEDQQKMELFIKILDQVDDPAHARYSFGQCVDFAMPKKWSEDRETFTTVLEQSLVSRIRNLDPKDKNEVEELDPQLYKDIDKVRSYDGLDKIKRQNTNIWWHILYYISERPYTGWSFEQCIQHLKSTSSILESIGKMTIQIWAEFEVANRALIERLLLLDKKAYSSKKRFELIAPDLYKDIQQRIGSYYLTELQQSYNFEWDFLHENKSENKSKINLLKIIIHCINSPWNAQWSFRECIDSVSGRYDNKKEWKISNEWAEFIKVPKKIEPIHKHGKTYYLYRIVTHDLVEKILALDNKVFLKTQISSSTNVTTNAAATTASDLKKPAVTHPQAIAATAELKGTIVKTPNASSTPPKPNIADLNPAKRDKNETDVKNSIAISVEEVKQTPTVSIAGAQKEQKVVTPAIADSEIKLSPTEVERLKRLEQTAQSGGGFVTEVRFQSVEKGLKEIRDRTLKGLEQAEAKIGDINQFLDRDPIAIKEQKEIDQYEKLQKYQQRLQTELSRFFTAYCLATTGLLQLTDNKLGTVLNGLGELPIAGQFFKILTVGLKKANDKYRTYQITRLGELFIQIKLDDIPKICWQFARKLSLAKKDKILQLETLDRSGIRGKLQGFYEDVRQFLYQQWHNLNTIDTTRVTLSKEEDEGYLDGALLIEKILSGNDVPKINPKNDLVPQFLAVMGVKNEANLAIQNRTVVATSPKPDVDVNPQPGPYTSLTPASPIISSPQPAVEIASASDVKALHRKIEDVNKRLDDAGIVVSNDDGTSQVQGVRSPNTGNSYVERAREDLHWRISMEIEVANNSEQVRKLQETISAQQELIERLTRKNRP